jgi:hypothetical protein
MIGDQFFPASILSVGSAYSVVQCVLLSMQATLTRVAWSLVVLQEVTT